MIPATALRAARSLLVGAASLAILLTMVPVGASAATSVTIRIGSTLSPSDVTVAPGTRLVWLNRDGDRHRVRTISGPGRFDSGNLEPGESWATTLTAEGSYGYVDDRDRDDAAYHGRIVVSRTASTGGTGGGTGGPTGGGSTGGGSTAGGAITTPPTTASVAIGKGSFGPGAVTIAASGSVTWRNSDDRAHTATGRTAAFDTGSIAPGRTVTRRFPAAGTFAYLCVFHPDMQGTVRVIAPGAATAPPPAPKPTPVATSTPATTGAGGGTASGGAPAPVSLRIVDLAFAPASASVAAGTTVTWTNTGIAPHTVTADGAFDSGMMAAGASWSRRFDQAGTFRFICTVHPTMTGSLTVTARVGTPAVPSSLGPGDAPVSSAAPAVGPSGGGAAAIQVAPDPSRGDPSSAVAPVPVSGIAIVDGGAIGRAALTILTIVIAVAFFGRLVRGVARP